MSPFAHKLFYVSSPVFGPSSGIQEITFYNSLFKNIIISPWEKKKLPFMEI